MRRITRESELQRLEEGRKIEACLRGLARRLGQISLEEAQEVMTLVQPEPAHSLGERNRILEAFDARA